MQRTLVILKPDCVQRRLAGEVLRRFEARGLRLVALKLIRVGTALGEEHYGEHKGKPFFGGLIEFITGGPVVVGVLAGNEAIAVVRAMLGATNGTAAAPGKTWVEECSSFVIVHQYTYTITMPLGMHRRRSKERLCSTKALSIRGAHPCIFCMFCTSRGFCLDVGGVVPLRHAAQYPYIPLSRTAQEDGHANSVQHLGHFGHDVGEGVQVEVGGRHARLQQPPQHFAPLKRRPRVHHHHPKLLPLLFESVLKFSSGVIRWTSQCLQHLTPLQRRP